MDTPSEDKVLKVIELSLDQSEQLQEVNRHPGENEVDNTCTCTCINTIWLQIGMVAWRLTLLTPCYPCGRDIIVIGNDITHQIGSFGPKEDLLYQV